MKINTDSNIYIYTFSIIMVVLVALLLSGSSSLLLEKQNENLRNEKRQYILKAIKIEVSREESSEAYNKYIVEQLILNSNGEIVKTGDEAFSIDLSIEMKKKAEERQYPVYIAKLDNLSDKKYYIIPMRGVGLWGPIWGYMSLEDNLTTVYGAIFDHKTETPGLGAEITKPYFFNQFVGKSIFDEQGIFKSIKVIKGGAKKDDPHGVDAISGSTITSRGVSNMVQNTFSSYEKYLKSINKVN